MFKLDKKYTLELIENKVEKIFIFFYEAWCSWYKIDVKTDFEISDDLEKLNLNIPFSIYVEKKDKDKFDWATIVRTIKADHTGKEKIRYIYSNAKVEDRCGCWSSFAFEKKKPQLNIKNLEEFKNKFKKS